MSISFCTVELSFHLKEKCDENFLNDKIFIMRRESYESLSRKPDAYLMFPADTRTGNRRLDPGRWRRVDMDGWRTRLCLSDSDGPCSRGDSDTYRRLYCPHTVRDDTTRPDSRLYSPHSDDREILEKMKCSLNFFKNFESFEFF